MVVLNRIYTRTGDAGETALGSGERVSKAHLRIQAYGTVDETNATLGLVRLHTSEPEMQKLDLMLGRIQNELFDLGADLCVPDTGKDLGYEPLRILPTQYERIEAEIDDLNGELSPLRSFVLPGGHPAAATGALPGGGRGAGLAGCTFHPLVAGPGGPCGGRDPGAALVSRP